MCYLLWPGKEPREGLAGCSQAGHWSQGVPGHPGWGLRTLNISHQTWVLACRTFPDVCHAGSLIFWLCFALEDIFFMKKTPGWLRSRCGQAGPGDVEVHPCSCTCHSWLQHISHLCHTLQGGFACTRTRIRIRSEAPTWEFPHLSPPECPGASAGLALGAALGKGEQSQLRDQGTWRRKAGMRRYLRTGMLCN